MALNKLVVQKRAFSKHLPINRNAVCPRYSCAAHRFELSTTATIACIVFILFFFIFFFIELFLPLSLIAMRQFHIGYYCDECAEGKTSVLVVVVGVVTNLATLALFICRHSQV